MTVATTFSSGAAAVEAIRFRAGVPAFGEYLIQKKKRAIWDSLSGCVIALVVLTHPAGAHADGQSSDCLSPPANGANSILIVSGEVEKPQQQVANLSRALARQRLGPIPIELKMVDERDPEAIGGQLAPALFSGRRAVVTLSGHVARALTARDPGPPILFATILDPMDSGIVDGVGVRRVNAAGVTYSVDTGWKYLEHLRIAFPRIRTVGMLADKYFFERAAVRELMAQSEARMGVKIIPFVADNRAELERVFESPHLGQLDAWIVPETPIVFRHEERVLELMGKRRIPNIFGHPSMIGKGAVMAFGVEFPAMWDEIATMVRMLCAGVEAREIPIVRPHRVFLGIGVTRARQRGLDIDPRIFRLATFWQ